MGRAFREKLCELLKKYCPCPCTNSATNSPSLPQIISQNNGKIPIKSISNWTLNFTILGANQIELNTIETGMIKQLQRMATIPDIEDEMENMEVTAIIECSSKQDFISP